MKRLQLASLAALAITLAIVPACDPGSPGVQGELSLDGVEVGDAMHLHMVMFPSEGDEFDASQMPEFDESTSMDYLDQTTFPFEYSVGGGIGTSDHRDWRVVAWLDTDASSTWLASGDAFGTTTFEVADCGAFIDGYCGDVLGIDFAIDSIAP